MNQAVTDKRRMKCCDPFRKHKGIIRAGLRKVDMSEIPLSLRSELSLPDDYWCDNCRKRAMKLRSEEQVEENAEASAGPSGMAVGHSAKSDDNLHKLEIKDEGESITNQETGDNVTGDKICKVEPLDQTTCTFAGSAPDISCSEAPFCLFSSLSKSESLALCWATGIWIFTQDATVCDAHYEISVGSCVRKEAEGTLSRKCCDPLQRHRNVVKSGLRVVTALAVVKAREKNIMLYAGDFLCDLCRKEIDSTEIYVPDSQVSSQESIALSGVSSHCMGLSPEVIKEELQQSLQIFQLSPVEMSASTSKIGRIQYAKRKIEDVSGVARKRICRALEIDESDVLSPEGTLNTAESDLMTICNEVKLKLAEVDSQTKIQYLTMCPPSWSTNFAANFFGVSRYLIDKARSLKDEKGIFSLPSYSTKGLPLPDSTKQLVINFFCDDENSRILPGKKDFVSIARNQHVQKRLVLCTLRELYADFKKKEEYKNLKIGFSLFCSLRPKWCVIAGSSGTHNVCVCTYHQNMKLMLHALRIQEPLQELIKYCVCSVANRECMLSLCSKCPSNDTIIEIIKSKFVEAWRASLSSETEGDSDLMSDDDFLEEDIEYKEWTSTDRAELLTRVSKVSELVHKVGNKMKSLIPHHFASRQQSEFLKNAKENLSEKKAIILMDFSMNYTCLVQDAVQSYHWSKKSVTVHPVVIYVKAPDGSVTHKSLCFISDDVTHDVSMVKVFQDQTIRFIKENFPAIDEVMFMTDGCGAQYKNCISFLHLCKIKEQYGIKATWCFCATSHGKCACDGIGGLVKREATKESLRRPLNEQILDAQSLYEFCQSHLSTSIQFFFVKKPEVDAQRLKDKSSPDKPTTIPGTRMFHHFFPLSDSVVGCKRVSTDSDFDIVHDLCPSTAEDDLHVELNSYVAVTIDGKEYIGLVMDINTEEKEADLTLLNPPLPSSVFSWPENELDYYVAPFPHILCTVKIQELDTKFQIPTKDILRIKQLGIKARAAMKKAITASNKRT